MYLSLGIFIHLVLWSSRDVEKLLCELRRASNAVQKNGVGV